MRDFLPADVRRRLYVIGVVRDVYERYGFQPLETPAVENIETLLGKYGEEGNQLIFKILKRGEHAASGQADLALRYDLTVPLARVVAEHRALLPKYFKRYQIQPVWRADRPARGRFREFYQCDVDAIGTTSPMVEAELCAAACEVMQALGFTDFTVRVNHRAVLSGVLDAAGVPADRHGDALVALDKLDKIGADGVRREFEQRGIEAGSATALMDALAGAVLPASDTGSSDGSDASADASERRPYHSSLDTLQRLSAFIGDHAEAQAGLDTLRRVLTLSERTPAAGRLRLDPSLARGLSYYTGCIMELAVPDLAGSLGGGGRYDNLVGMFGKEQVPAAGFSLGLERILVVMTERDMFPVSVGAAPADLLVTVWNAETLGDSLALAHELRAGASGGDVKGLRVDVYPEADKLGKQFKYAAALGVPFVAVVGDDERASGTVTIKNLLSGEQTGVPRADVAPYIRSLNPQLGRHPQASSL
jgi:histidyl-tRNA synthetase